MSEPRYIISDASKKLKVEPHVLRYWEEELSLDIPRNEMGHRYYKEENLLLLAKIKKMKEKGMHLKAIKLAMPRINEIDQLDDVSFYKVRDELNRQAEGNFDAKANGLSVVPGTGLQAKPLMEAVKKASKETKTPAADSGRQEEGGPDKMDQFRMIMRGIISEAMQENQQGMAETVSGSVSERVIKEIDYLVRDKEEREEERFRQLDEIIRGVQRTRQEAAVTDLALQEEQKKTKKRLFGRKK